MTTELDENMSKELGVLIIHGMGSQTEDYADAMTKELSSRIDDRGKDSDQVAWKPVYWADVLESKQLRYLRDARRGGDLDFIKLRRFIITAIGDASAYRKVEKKTQTTYDEIHKRIEDNVRELYEKDLEAKDKPLVVLAHSLGGHIMSNYIWDRQTSQNSKMSAFEKQPH